MKTKILFAFCLLPLAMFGQGWWMSASETAGISVTESDTTWFAYSTANALEDLDVAGLSSTTFVIAYRDPDNYYGKVKIGTLSGTDVTYGTSVTFNAAETNYISVSALSSTSFVVAYKDVGGSNYGRAVICTISGSTITAGSEYVFNSAETTYVSVSAASSSSFVVAYKDVGGSNYGRACIGTVSTRTITFGAEYVFNSATTDYVSVAALSSSTFVVAYKDVGGSNYGRAVACTFSGTTITVGSEYAFNSASTYAVTIVALSSSSFSVVYTDQGNNSYGTSCIGTVSTRTITFGAEYVFNQEATYPTLSFYRYGIAKVDANNFICIYSQGTYTDDNAINYISLTTRTIDSNQEFDISNYFNNYTMSLSSLSSTLFAACGAGFYTGSSEYGGGTILLTIQ